jgi:hypothetical protein
MLLRLETPFASTLVGQSSQAKRKAQCATLGQDTYVQVTHNAIRQEQLGLSWCDCQLPNALRIRATEAEASGAGRSPAPALVVTIPPNPPILPTP